MRAGIVGWGIFLIIAGLYAIAGYGISGAEDLPKLFLVFLAGFVLGGIAR